MIERERHDDAGGRYIRRIVVLEEPDVVQTLVDHASENGRSLAAEVRAAIRTGSERTSDRRRQSRAIRP